MKVFTNPDRKVVKEIKKQLKENNGYCPCALIHTPQTKCMCQDFRQQTEPGYCHCGLYYKAEVEEEK